MANILANKALFGDLCNLLENIYKKKINVQEKERILCKYILDFKCNAAKEKLPKNTSFYPILRLLVPSYERERGAYNLKEPKLGVLLVKVLSLNKQSHDAQKLLNRTLNNQDADFGNVAYFVLKNRVAQKTSSMTIGDVNEILDKIASAEVGNKGPILDDLFSKVMRNLTAEQIKWFLRIVLKDLKLGMSVKRILSCYHPDAPEHYEKFGNLAKVCDELEDGNVRPLELGIEIFYAVSPMLSERLDVTDIGGLPTSKTYQIEEKFDGERFQIHMENQPSDENPEERNHVYEYFSRKGFSFSSSYGKTYNSGLLTPHLKDCFSSHVTSFILDGEMMGWHKERQCFGSKGMAFDVKKLTENSRFQPCFCAFDILYFNGRCLVGPEDQGGMKLSERLKLLDAMFRDVKGVIQHSKRKIVMQSSDILNALNNAIDNQDEGIVVKDTESYYIANKRNAGWYKLKPEYTDGVMDDLDMVVIGVDAAVNAKQGVAKSFLLAVADSVSGLPPHRWLCVGRVATGLTYEQRDAICTLLKKKWVVSRLAPPPPALVFNKIKPDYWVLPEHSIVLQVRATELIRSTDFGTPYTLRFARVKRVRDDKPIGDVTTLQEFNKLIENAGPVIKLGTKRIGEELIGDTEAKTRKKRTVNKLEVPDELKMITVGDVEVISSALKDRKICILSDDEDCTREELVRIVKSHGGIVVANPGPDTWCSVVGRATFRARNLIAQAADVASTAWLRGLRPAAGPRALAPLDLLAASRRTRAACAREYDAFGDSYKDLTTEETLKRCFKKITDEEPEIYLTTQEMIDLDRELFGDNNPFSFLRPCFIHVASGARSLLAIRSRMFGATLCDLTDFNLTHVVVPKNMAASDVQTIKEKLVASKALVVSEEWLQKCFAQEKLVSDSVFSM